MNDRLDIIYNHDPSIVSRMIAGETILVPIRKNVGDMEHIYTLNETGARIWELIDGTHTVEEVLQQIVREFEVDPEQAKSDLLELIDGLLEQGTLTKV